MLKHSETIMAAQSTRTQIKDNNKRIKKIEKNIRKDKNEDMYGLESFDSQIKALYDDIAFINLRDNISLGILFKILQG